MDAVLRATAVYLVLILLFRMTGKRTLGQVTTFDFIILLIVGEATQQALLGEDFSIVHASLVIATLLGLERLSDYLKEHLDEEDILGAARQTQGLERLDQIKWAVLDTNGGISIVPKANAAPNA